MPIIWLQLVFLFFALTAHTATFVRTSDHIRYLTTVDEEGDEQVIETTDSHPVWVVTDNPDLSRAAQEVVVENGTTLIHENLAVTEHGYYVEAKDLKVGDVFIGANGELTTLTGTERVEYANGITVYNFTVADNHNYFVIGSFEAYENGASIVLVHNAGYEKPMYQTNPAHDTRSPHYNPKKTPEPADAEKVYAKSIQNPDKPGTWYAYANEKIYRFVSKNNTTSHFNGYIGENSKATVKQMLNRMRQWGWKGE